jgi:3'-phosphoadenosine 5'-phosphosulfate sulfotransferase (PAPS reductase)/FAD synthetase
LFSGGHDSTVVAHRCRHDYDELVFIDTTTAVPGVRDYVEQFAAWIEKPLRVMEPDHDAFREMVVGTDAFWESYESERARLLNGWHSHNDIAEYLRRLKDMPKHLALPLNRAGAPIGFPGPAQHGRAYAQLKERQIARLIRDAKQGHDHRARVLLVTGVRRAESQRRASRPPITKKGGAVFANPLIDWTGSMMREYRGTRQLPESDAAALLHRSGECNCGAFAGPGEREDLMQFYPSWFERRIASLEREAKARGLSHCRWGHGSADAAPADVGALCTDCELRLIVAEEAS